MSTLESELHLFIIWNNAKHLKEKIIDDISTNFIIEKVIEIEWSKQRFPINLRRFYGKKLEKMIDCLRKAKQVGVGPFTLVIISDLKPNYDFRLTSRGVEEYVNTNMFDQKAKYRNWVSNSNSKIHGTNNQTEFSHDLMMLLGLSAEEFESKKQSIGESIKSDIIGTKGWKSLSQVFGVLNSTIPYVVLRNYDYLPDKFVSDLHGDIDLLTTDELEIAYILNAKKIIKKDFRVQYYCKIGKSKVKFDFRYIGDNYYCKTWEENILQSRSYYNGFNIPNDENYYYSLLYHAIVQKKKISPDYLEKLNKYFGDVDLNELLLRFMDENNYSFVEPKDLTVYFNSTVVGIPCSETRTEFYKRSERKLRLRNMIK